MRWLGAALCFLTCCLAGIFAGRSEREHAAQCEAFLAFFLYIRNQVGTFLTPTKRIYRSFENPVLARTGFLAALTAQETEEIYHDAWERALASCRGRLRLNETQYELVRAFGACVGKSNEAWQMRSFDYYLAQMQSETEKQRAETKKNEKLYRTIGFSLGAAIAILIL